MPQSSIILSSHIVIYYLLHTVERKQGPSGSPGEVLSRQDRTIGRLAVLPIRLYRSKVILGIYRTEMKMTSNKSSLKSFVFGLILGLAVGLWFGMNIGKNRPLWSNPFGSMQVGKQIRQQSGDLLEKSGRMLEKKGEKLKK